jgi:hypothetical protein
MTGALQLPYIAGDSALAASILVMGDRTRDAGRQTIALAAGRGDR